MKIARPRTPSMMPMIMKGVVLMAAGYHTTIFRQREYTHLSSLVNTPGWNPIELKYFWLHQAVTLISSLCVPRSDFSTAEQVMEGGWTSQPPMRMPFQLPLMKWPSLSISLSMSLSQQMAALRSAEMTSKISLPTKATTGPEDVISLIEISCLGRTFSSMIGQLLMRYFCRVLQLRYSQSLKGSQQMRLHCFLGMVEEVTLVVRVSLPKVSCIDRMTELQSTMKRSFLLLSQARSLMLREEEEPELSLFSSAITLRVLSLKSTEKIAMPSSPNAAAKQFPQRGMAVSKSFFFQN